MSDDLDLRALHQRHEPDPEFRAALRQRVTQVISQDRAVVPDPDDPIVDFDDSVVDLGVLDLDELALRHGSRRRPWAALLLVAAAATVIVIAVVIRNSLDEGPPRVITDPPTPAESTPVPGDAVWYDASGLHRGDVVEQTPAEIMARVGDDSTAKGALALVRSGAVYLDPATHDIWFQPWGGQPRIVGHNSAWGPGGDPNGDTAAWFEGSELVVYDTAAGREISRTAQPGYGVYYLTGDHWPTGNGFLQVSAERVVWADGQEPLQYSYDLGTQKTSVVGTDTGWLLDVHDDVEILHLQISGIWSWVLRVSGRAEETYPELENRARLSPSGNYALVVESSEKRHAAAIVDTRTGELWPVPEEGYPWIAWSYGDTALVDVDDTLLACDATRRACERLQPDRPFLMPTN